MKLFKLKAANRPPVFIHPDSIIRIRPVDIKAVNPIFKECKSIVELRFALVTSEFDDRAPEELAEQINRECYNVKQNPIKR